jgi:hypothetical protein
MPFRKIRGGKLSLNFPDRRMPQQPCTSDATVDASFHLGVPSPDGQYQLDNLADTKNFVDNVLPNIAKGNSEAKATKPAPNGGINP